MPKPWTYGEGIEARCYECDVLIYYDACHLWCKCGYCQEEAIRERTKRQHLRDEDDAIASIKEAIDAQTEA